MSIEALAYEHLKGMSLLYEAGKSSGAYMPDHAGVTLQWRGDWNRTLRLALCTTGARRVRRAKLRDAMAHVLRLIELQPSYRHHGHTGLDTVEFTAYTHKAILECLRYIEAKL